MTQPDRNSLTHFDQAGAARMVDVGSKPETRRRAIASARVEMAAATAAQVRAGEMGKGNVLEVARLAGIMGAKRTWELIPMCHPLALEAVELNFHWQTETCLEIQATTQITAKTGVEMEALTAASVAALTIYDMCKAIDRGMTILEVGLLEKSGGKSGHFQRSPQAENTSRSASPDQQT